MIKHLRWLMIFTLLCSAIGAFAQAPTYPLPIGSPVLSSGSLLELPSRRLLVANTLSDTISIIAPSGGVIDSEIAVGDAPSSVALAADGIRAVVANREEGTVSVVDLIEETVLATYEVGALPYAVLVREGTIYVTLQGEASVRLLDLETGEEQARIAVPDSPAGMAIWGNWLYVTHYWSGELSLIDRSTNERITTIATGADIAHFASIAIDRRYGLAYLPQTIPNVDLVDAAPEAYMLPIVNVVDLSEMALQPDLQIFLPVADRMVNMPQAALIDRGRNLLYVTHAGSASMTALDLDTGYARYGFLPLNTGSVPVDVVLSVDALTLYIHNAIDQSITEYDAFYRSLNDTMSASDSVPETLPQIGARLFYDADDPRLSAQHSMSCANCHVGGFSDGRTWGDVSTPALRQGDERASFDANWLEGHIQQQGGTGLGVDSIDMQALIAYLQTLAARPAAR